MNNQNFTIEQEGGFRITGSINPNASESNQFEVMVCDTLVEPRISKTRMDGSSMLHALAAATSLAAAKLSGHELMEKKQDIMPTRVCTAVMSHMSDMQHMTGSIQTMRVNNLLNFCKLLLSKYPNTDIEIDADAEWEAFTKTRFYRTEK